MSKHVGEEPTHQRKILVLTLSSEAAQLLLLQLDEALAERELLWRNVLSGTEDAMQDLPTPSLRHLQGITFDGGCRFRKVQQLWQDRTSQNDVQTT